jgi:hypothetical protein
VKCADCGKTVWQEEADRVLDSFDIDDLEICFSCAEIRWNDERQTRTMNNPPQDEGDGL